MTNNTDKSDNELKLTKSALAKIIQWSTSRYNDYLGFGTKKEAVERVHYALLNGFDQGTGKAVFEVECATGNGEGHGGRHWRLSGKGSDWKYLIDIPAMQITGHPSGKVFKFHNSQSKQAQS